MEKNSTLTCEDVIVKATYLVDSGLAWLLGSTYKARNTYDLPNVLEYNIVCASCVLVDVVASLSLQETVAKAIVKI